MKNRLLSGAVLGLCFAVSACSGPVADDDVSEFVQKASVSNMFEIQSSELALQRAVHPEVRNLAQQMVTDHTSAGEELRSAAQQAGGGIAPASALDDKHQKLLEDLQKASPEEFDNKYVDMQRSAHAEAITLFRDFSDGGKDGPVKAFAASTLPTLEAHEAHVKQVDEQTPSNEMASVAASEATSPTGVP